MKQMFGVPPDPILALDEEAAAQGHCFSQEELADMASIDRTYISSLERCLYAVSVDIIDRLASALGVDPPELLRRPPSGP